MWTSLTWMPEGLLRVRLYRCMVCWLGPEALGHQAEGASAQATQPLRYALEGSKEGQAETQLDLV